MRYYRNYSFILLLLTWYSKCSEEWNTHGFEIAETFAAKFDLVSPVWFQVLGRKKSYTIVGVPDIKKDWLKSIRAVNPNLKIVPRFIFEGWRTEDFAETFNDVSNMNLPISNIIKLARQYKFDGAVIEIWSQFFGLPEHDHPGRFTHRHFEKLFTHVDYFSLMTYDYSPLARPGPNSPIKWIEKCITMLVPPNVQNLKEKRAKLLTGFNFYGLNHVPQRQFGEHILGHRLIEIAKNTRAKFIWDEATAEHHLHFRDEANMDNYVYYPTLMSLARRISLIHELGTGMAIWEIGQGLDSFYTLF